MSHKRKVSRSGLEKITKAVACGFVPGNGFCGPGLYLRRRKNPKKLFNPLGQTNE